MSKKSVLLFICIGAVILGGASAYATVIEHYGDVTITSNTNWGGDHHKIHGNLYLNSGTLTLTSGGIIEMMCTYSREFRIEFNGGTLSTTSATVGGTKDANNKIRQFYVNMDSGSWSATNTTIRYSYGIVLTGGTLTASNLIKGENPDSIIMGGSGTANLSNSSFDLSLLLNGDVDQTVELDLPTSQTSQDYGSGYQPGVSWSLNLTNHTASLWFLFFSGVANSGTLTTYNLDDCPNVLCAFDGTNLTGTAYLPCSYYYDEDVEDHPKFSWRAMPTTETASVGALRVKALRSSHTNLGCWGVYLYGSSTSLFIGDTTYIAECLVYDGGKLAMVGDSDTYSIWLANTTTEAREGSQILVRNATLGYFQASDILPTMMAMDSSSSLIKVENAVLGSNEFKADYGNILVQNWDQAYGSTTDAESNGGYVFWHYSMAEAVYPSATSRNNFTGYVGMKIYVSGEDNLYLQRIGRYFLSGNTGSHTLYVVRASDKAVLGYGTIDMDTGWPWADEFGYKYAWLNTTVTLVPGNYYYIMSSETSSGDYWYDYDSQISARWWEVYSTSAVWSSNLSTFYEAGAANYSYVPLNIIYQQF